MTKEQFPFDVNQTRSLYVILSAVELLQVERSERAEAQGVAAAGSRNKLRWLANGMLHPVKKPPKLVRRSLRRIRSSVLARIVACGSLPHKNFDFAQDDIQWGC